MTEEEMLLVNGGEKAKDETVVTVESGDTLSELTAKLNEQNGTDYTYEEIALLNGITDPDTIYAGQTIVFPGTSQPESGSDSGSSGDTPSSPSSSNSTNDATANTVKGPEHHSAYDQQYINEMMENSRKNALGGNGIQGTAVSGKRIEGQEIKVNPGAGDMTVTERIASEKKKMLAEKLKGMSISLMRLTRM
jgi:LysM repeat protein